jgi:probable F420-dependent oxidoreductase
MSRHATPTLGVVLPTMGAGASIEAVEAVAGAASRLGLTDVWVPDHVLVDRSVADQYGAILDPIVALTHVAATNPGLRIGTAVLIAPMRNAVVLSKELATLDHVARGRLQVGVGSGWSAAEFANVAPAGRFHERGAYLDETIDLWRHLWSGTTSPFEGRFLALHDFAFGPLPPQGATIPIWVGGRSAAAIRRAARRGDGHIATQTTPDELAERREQLAREAHRAGRPMPRIAARMAVSESERRDPASAVERIRAYGAVGAEQVVVSFGTTDANELVPALERLAGALFL